MHPVSQMFIPTLLSQASPDQQAEWLPKALGLRLIGKASASVQMELRSPSAQRHVSTNADLHVFHTVQLKVSSNGTCHPARYVCNGMVEVAVAGC